MANKVELPPEAMALLEKPEVQTAAATQVAPQAPQAQAAPAPAAQPAEAVTFAKKEEAPAEEEQKRMPMMKLIGTLNTAQKVALATKGNKEARAILIKDANKMVATSVIKSPGITEQEIAAAAASRSVNEDVIRIICKSASMMRGYSVKVALVNNPRTPLPLAMKLLTQLRKNDVKMVSKSKGLPAALVNLAKKLATS
jgi:sulfur relay (sulfurtransferase) complex TusBCD TusD component (DsrE family)